MNFFDVLKDKKIKKDAYKHVEQAQAYFEKGDYDNAIQASIMAIKSFPVDDSTNIENMNGEDRFFFAQIYNNMGDAYAKKALKIKNDSPEFFNLINESLIKYKKVLEYISESKDKGLSVFLAEIHNNIGANQSFLGDKEESVKSRRKAVELNPLYHEAYFNLGYTLYELKRYDEAIFEYTNAFKVKKDYTLAYYDCGKIHEVLGDNEKDKNKMNEFYAKSIDLFTEAINHEKHNQRQKAVYYHARYSVYMKTEQIELAEQDSVQVTRLFPDFRNPDNWHDLHLFKK